MERRTGPGRGNPGDPGSGLPAVRGGPLSKIAAGRPEPLGIREARALALAAGAGFPPRYPAGQEGAARAVEAMGYVQIDTISVVRRAHEHVLWSRVPDPGFAAVPALEGVGGGERRLVEYWAHAASYLPVEEWRYCLPRMLRIRTNGHEWFNADPKAVSRVRDRVAAEGPLSARDFQEPMSGPRGWWDWKPAKVALEYLFHSGELACVTRRGFQKVYDLSERQIPAVHAGPAPTEAELSGRHVERAARSQGLFTKAQAVYLRKDGLVGMGAALAASVESGILVPAVVEGLGPGWFARRVLLERPAPGVAAGGTGPDGAAPSGSSSTASPGRAFVLSPFDPFLIDRRRTARLWDFDYTIECYVPAARRAFGYFALPILYVTEDPGEARFAGLLDAKADRRRRTLILQRLRLACRGSVSPAGGGIGPAPARTSPAVLARAVAAEIGRFAAFQGSETLELGILETDDPRLDKAFRREFARASEGFC